ncbi:MAG: DUF6796 family protein [Lachnospiraceae bacterium]
MKDFNDIGISCRLDWPRIQHLFRLGLFGAFLTLIGDLILGWGVQDETLTGILRMYSAYTGTSDGGIFASALLGLLGLILEGLCYFGVYRLFAENAPQYAHRYRAGIFGYVIFGGCGFHVPVCAAVFLMKHGLSTELLEKYAAYFVTPSTALFWIFFLVLVITQIQVFAKRLTPYPKGCWVFSLPVGMAAAMLPKVFGNQPWVNALTCAWISIGNLWMFGGLLAAMKKARINEGGNEHAVFRKTGAL